MQPPWHDAVYRFPCSQLTPSPASRSHESAATANRYGRRRQRIESNRSGGAPPWRCRSGRVTATTQHQAVDNAGHLGTGQSTSFGLGTSRSQTRSDPAGLGTWTKLAGQSFSCGSVRYSASREQPRLLLPAARTGPSYRTSDASRRQGQGRVLGGVMVATLDSSQESLVRQIVFSPPRHWAPRPGRTLGPAEGARPEERRIISKRIDATRSWS